MAEEERIDFTQPGRLWAKAEFQKDVTFRLVFPRDEYTKAQLTQNPQIRPGDDLIPPFTAPYKTADKDGICSCDLGESGRAQAALEKLDKLFQAGESIEKVRAIYIATARDGNRIPEARIAEVKDFKLAPVPSIALRGLGNPVEVAPHTEGTYVTVKQFKAGKKFHEAELTVKCLKEVQITTSPAAQIQVEGGPQGNGSLTMPVEGGRAYKVKVATLHKVTGKQSRAGRKTYPVFQNWISGGWQTGYVGQGEYDAVRKGWKCAGETDARRVRGPAPGWTNTWYQNGYFDAGSICWQFIPQEADLWAGGTVVLRVAGTGEFRGIIRSLNLESNAFASEADWADGPPPPALAHNNC